MDAAAQVRFAATPVALAMTWLRDEEAGSCGTSTATQPQDPSPVIARPVLGTYRKDGAEGRAPSSCYGRQDLSAYEPDPEGTSWSPYPRTSTIDAMDG
jgi:hypothetical protein